MHWSYECRRFASAATASLQVSSDELPFQAVPAVAGVVGLTGDIDVPTAGAQEPGAVSAGHHHFESAFFDAIGAPGQGTGAHGHEAQC